MSYEKRLKGLLNARERVALRQLGTPQRIQDYLDTLSINYETGGETYMSPRRVLAEKRAHCFEGAVLAAAALAYHGRKPLLLDFQTRFSDEDHVVALFREGRFWGAISKTNHPVLRYRDAVFASPRELAMSYFNEYALNDGRKSMRAYSAPFDVSRYMPETWVTAEGELQWLVDALDRSRHFPIAPKKNMGHVRKADAIELRAQECVEWERSGKRRHYRYRPTNN